MMKTTFEVKFFVNINILSTYQTYLLREGIKKKEEEKMEFWTKVDGWGQQWTDFPLIFFFFEKKIRAQTP